MRMSASIEPDQTISRGDWRRHVAIWLGLLALALVLLWGRYAWSEASSSYSLRGYLGSAYLLVLTLPTLYYLLRALDPGGKLAGAVTAGAAVILTLPYHWLGLSQGYDDSGMALGLSDEGYDQAKATWWCTPHDLLYFGALLAVGVAGAGIFLWRARRAQPGRLPPLAKAALWLALYALILLQTWLHLGMRSPLCYLGRNCQTLLPPHQGVVITDYSELWRPLEEHFMGCPRLTPSEMIRRSYLFYLTSQLTYFVNPFYVVPAVNVALWMLACFCAYRLGTWWHSREVGAYFALLVGTGTGFIAMVGQIASYEAQYALYIILPCVFEGLIVRNPNRGWGAWLLFGTALGLASLVYDLFPLYLFFVGYALLRRLSWLRLSVSLSLAAGVYAGFLSLQWHLPEVDTQRSGGAALITDAAAKTVATATELNFGRIYELFLTTAKTFFEYLVYDFFVLPVVLAIAGLAALRDRFTALALGLLILPAFVVLAVLRFGQSPVAGYPRFMYIAYPTIYFLTAVFLSALAGALRRGAWRRLAPLPAGLTLLAVALLGNSDMIGSPYRTPPPETYWWFLLDWRTPQPYAEAANIPPAAEAPLPVVPAEVNAAVWKYGAATCTGGAASFLEFALGRAMVVYGIRLKYVYPDKDGPHHFRICWREQERNDFTTSERYCQLELPTAEEPVALFIPVNDTITEFRIYPDDKPGRRTPFVFKLDHIGVLVNGDDYEFLTREPEEPDYEQLVERVCRQVCELVPAEATLIVFSHGDQNLLRLGPRQAWHFPRTKDGEYDRSKPANSAEAVAWLEALHTKGARFVVIPQPAFWWLQEYPGLRQFLDARYWCLHGDRHFVLYELVASPRPVQAP
jgi:hypothetical protein